MAVEQTQGGAQGASPKQLTAEERIAQLESIIAEMQKTLAAKPTILPPAAPKAEGELEDPLSHPMVRSAMDAYGIRVENIAETDGKPAVSVMRGRAVIVTKGGFKAKFERGDKVKKLTPVQLGVPPPKPEPEDDED